MSHVYGHSDIYAGEPLRISQVMNIEMTAPSIPQARTNECSGHHPSLLFYGLQQRGNTRAFAQTDSVGDFRLRGRKFGGRF